MSNIVNVFLNMLRGAPPKVSNNFLDLVAEKAVLQDIDTKLKDAWKEMSLLIHEKPSKVLVYRSQYKERLYGKAMEIKELGEDKIHCMGEISRLEKLQSR